MDQAVVEGSEGGALLGKLLQTFFTKHLGSRKVQLVTVTLVSGCSPENRTGEGVYRPLVGCSRFSGQLNFPSYSN